MIDSMILKYQKNRQKSYAANQKGSLCVYVCVCIIMTCLGHMSLCSYAARISKYKKRQRPIVA